MPPSTRPPGSTTAPGGQPEPRDTDRDDDAAAPSGGAAGTHATPPTARSSGEPPATARLIRRLADNPPLAYLFVAFVCYVPLLLTKPGVVSDDTKTYLYYDAGRFTRSSASIWDPAVALGSVTHQNIGYLFPMGPFFWIFSVLHVPVWIAQRLWLGSILFAAAAGVLYLCRILGINGLARVVAALAYGLAPYVMQYAGRISVILLPFAGLGWMMAFIVLACRYKGWRYPALFALVVALVSGINASSIVYVGVASLLWLLYSTFVLRELSGREAIGVALRTGVLTLFASLWWIVGLSIEGLYGVDILKYTESVEATSSASTASEVIRGLGYWYFYGGDRIGLWTNAADEFTYRVPLLALTYAVPVLAFVSAAFVRFRHRAFFVLLVAVGLVLSVGAHPFVHPTPFGILVKTFMTKTTIGLALRSTDRATPLVTLGLAMLLGIGVAAALRSLRRYATTAAVLAGVIAIAANAPLIAGRGIISQFSQPVHPPSYVSAAARYLNSVHPGYRVYSLPGDNFAAYRWGDTVDPIWPALLTKRPYVIHEQQIQGSMPTANLLYALDNPLQQGTMDWRALAPISRLMSAANVLVEYDQQYERYNAPRPALVQHDLAVTPPGITKVASFGPPTLNRSSLAMLDETYFDLPPNARPPHPLVVYDVAHPRPVVRAESLAAPLVVAGDNVGLVQAADAGLLAHDPTIFFSGSLDEDPQLAKAIAASKATLVLTDSNRKQSFEWNSLAENAGYTLTANGQPGPAVANDPGMDLFPGAPVAARTTTVLTGVRSVTASSYGTAFTLRSEFRPANAIDRNVATSWQTEGTVEAPIAGQWWEMTLRHPVTANSVRITQPIPQRNATWLTNRFLTQVTLTFDGKHPETVDLGPSSRTPAGQVVTFPRHKFQTLRITIDETNDSHLFPQPVGASLVGLASVQLLNVHATQIITLPSDLLDRYGASSLQHRLSILLQRDRVAAVPPRSDPEADLVRGWNLPTARSFSLTGTARLSNDAPDPLIDSLVGRHPAGRGDPVVVAQSSSRMPGNLGATASATLDGSDSTVWMPGLGSGANVNSFLDYQFRRPLTVNHLTLVLSSDKEHSVPSTVVVSSGGEQRVVQIPHVAVTTPAGSVTAVPIHFPAVRGSSLELRFTHLAPRRTLSYQTSLETTLPIGVAEARIPGVSRLATPASLPSSCRSDLLRVDQQRVWLRVTGSSSTALAGNGLAVSLCGPDRHGFHLAAGKHVLVAANGAGTGINLDELALDSAPGGAAMPLPGPAGSGLTPAAPGAASGGANVPGVHVLQQSSTQMTLRVSGAHAPFMLVLGQSHDLGWTATVTGVPGAGSLGHPILVDGFANGWRVGASTLRAVGGRGSFEVVLRFFPQRELDVAFLVSLVTALGCLAIIVLSLVRRRRRRAVTTAEVVDAAEEGAAPTIVSPIGEAAPQRRLAITLGIAVACGLVALFFGGPITGVLVALGVLGATRLRWGRGVLTIGSLAAMVVAVGGVLLIQIFDRYPPGPGWPSHFDLPSEIVWVAVTLLAADAGIELVRRRNQGHRTAHDDPAGGPANDQVSGT